MSADMTKSKFHLSPTAAFYLQASITVIFLAGSSAPSPLYPVYQAAWGFSPIAITVIFGVYALAVLAALLVFREEGCRITSGDARCCSSPRSSRRLR